MYEKNLDYFRGVLASIVVIVHTYQILILPLIYEEDSIILKFMQFMGAYAVVGFILISGYSIMGSLHFNFLSNNRKIDIKSFIKGRTLRILPPFIYSLFIIIFVVFVISFFQLNGSDSFRLEQSLYVPREKAIYNWENIFYNLFFLPGVVYDIQTPLMNGALWSLNFEVYFYLYLLLFSLIYSNIKNNFFLCIFLILFIISTIAFQFFYKNHTNMQFLYFLMMFLLGSISYLIKYYRKNIIKKLKFLFLIVLGIIVLLLIFKIKYFMPYASYNTMLLLSIFFVLIYSLFLSEKRLYFEKFFFSISKYSYTLYVIHFPLLLLVLSLIHENLYDLNILEIIILLIIVVFFIFIFSKISSLVVERKNYK